MQAIEKIKTTDDLVNTEAAYGRNGPGRTPIILN